MKEYEVIRFFTDLRDYDHAYNVGDKFPRQGVTVSEDRLAELSSDRNRQGRPLIRAVEGSGNQKPEEQQSQNALAQDETPASTATTENADESETPEQPATPNAQEDPEQAVANDVSAESNKYSKEDIEALKLPQIRELAGKLGFKISSTSKDKAVVEFMEKQG